ncbi:hypothetical protein NMY22_g5456 [Coprinellus aureogranulatus]|nr:hypothetical protein NMY22_g5456 [Coprinellus aureogranulatus]
MRNDDGGCPTVVGKPGFTCLNFELPPAIRSVRDGWQATFQSAAVVSGLLVGVGSQLYDFFKDRSNYSDNTSEVYQDVILALCYATMFLNIGATLSGFLITESDAMGSMQYRAATVPEESAGKLFDAQDVCNGKHRYVRKELSDVLKAYTRGLRMNMLVLHWLVSFTGGIVSLLALILLYAVAEEKMGVKIVAGLLTVYAILPAFYWVWRLVKTKDGVSGCKVTAAASSVITGNPSQPVATPLLPQHAERVVRNQQLGSKPSSSNGAVHGASP